MAKNIETVGDLMGKWPTDADFARDIGVKPTHAQTMKVRGSIPPDYWPRVVTAAEKRGIPGITLDRLSKLRQKRFGAPRTAA